MVLSPEIKNKRRYTMIITSIIPVISLFIITSLMNVLTTLKTILISKKIMNPVYMVVFIDAMIFASILTKVTSSEGLQYTLAYALGKSFGVFLGGKLDDKMALGIIEVDIFISNNEKRIIASEALRAAGYSVNNYLARGLNGDRRYKIEVVLKRKEMPRLEEIMSDCDISNPTMKIKSISKVAGKLTMSKPV